MVAGYIGLKYFPTEHSFCFVNRLFSQYCFETLMLIKFCMCTRLAERVRVWISLAGKLSITKNRGGESRFTEVKFMFLGSRGEKIT